MVYSITVILIIIGFLLSAYSFYVVKKMKKEKNYKAVCDISDRVSCTRAFSSKYGEIFGLSNTIYGMIFYAIIFILALFGFINYIFYLSIFSVIGSIYLAYVLYFKLHNLCLVCHGIYLVNLLLLIFSYVKVF